jgi:hypothetical protein
VVDIFNLESAIEGHPVRAPTRTSHRRLTRRCAARGRVCGRVQCDLSPPRRRCQDLLPTGTTRAWRGLFPLGRGRWRGARVLGVSSGGPVMILLRPPLAAYFWRFPPSVGRWLGFRFRLARAPRCSRSGRWPVARPRIVEGAPGSGRLSPGRFLLGDHSWVVAPIVSPFDEFDEKFLQGAMNFSGASNG